MHPTKERAPKMQVKKGLSSLREGVSVLLALSFIGILAQDSFGGILFHRNKCRQAPCCIKQAPCCIKEVACCTNNADTATPTVPVRADGSVDFSAVNVQDLMSKIGNVPKGPEVNQALLDKLLQGNKLRLPSALKNGEVTSPSLVAPEAPSAHPAPSMPSPVRPVPVPASGI